MIEFKKKSNYRFWHSPIVLVFIFCIFMLFLYNIIGLIEKERETSHKKDLILEEIDLLKEREASLGKDMLKLETEEGKEAIIREKYQVAKEGEKMVIIVDQKDEIILPKNKEKVDHGFWNWFKKFFEN
jgi:hypothetical protein